MTSVSDPHCQPSAKGGKSRLVPVVVADVNGKDGTRKPGQDGSHAGTFALNFARQDLPDLFALEKTQPGCLNLHGRVDEGARPARRTDTGRAMVDGKAEAFVFNPDSGQRPQAPSKPPPGSIKSVLRCSTWTHSLSPFPPVETQVESTVHAGALLKVSKPSPTDEVQPDLRMPCEAAKNPADGRAQPDPAGSRLEGGKRTVEIKK